MTQTIAYIPGYRQPQSGPLGRYLPPVPDGVGASWLRQKLPPGAWVVDPFGTSPRLALEAARAGYRVLAAVNNPISRFLFELHSNPPSEHDLRLTLADLAASTKSGERLEPHLRSLYLTRCASCSAEVEAQAFVWERGASGPAAKIYTCPHCKDSGERPANSQDAERASRSAGGPLHRARALERVARMDDPDRSFVEEALSMYPPRAVYALFTLVNKLDSAPATQRRSLEMLLLAAFDRGSVMWTYPATRQRPKQLSTPPRYLEHNIWLALEEAVTAWPAALRSEDPIHPSLVSWPELPPPEGGVCLFEGRLRNLAAGVRLAGGTPEAAHPSEETRPTQGEVESVGESHPVGGLPFRIEAMLTALPRPNQAFWTLSALWSGWLWGAESSAAIKSVLHRRRYDWDWHTEALFANLHHLAELLPAGTPALGLMGEAEPGFLSAALAAADRAGFSLNGIALRSDEGQAQIEWQRSDAAASPTTEDAAPLATVVRQAAESYLRRRGEPCGYLELHAAILSELAGGRLAAETSTASERSLERLNASLSVTLEAQGNFARFSGSSRSLEVGLWWLPALRRETGKVESPLADRVEIQTVNFLLDHPGSSSREVDQSLCAAFPGLLTPERELVRRCLESYGEADETGGWRLRAEDDPRTRHQDLDHMADLLKMTGERLGFAVAVRPIGNGPKAVRWEDAPNREVYRFYVVASAVMGNLLIEDQRFFEQDRHVYPLIVLPGGRAALVEYKLRRDPRLTRAMQEGWRLVKFRHVRRLADDPLLSRENLQAQLGLDPLENRDAQMALL